MGNSMLPKTPDKPTAERLPQSWLAALQQRLTTRYGSRFSAALSSPQTTREWREDWGDVLAGLSGEDIAGGLRALTERAARAVERGAEDWPPTAAEFRAICVQSREPVAYRQLAEPRIEPSEESRERVAEAVAQSQASASARSKAVFWSRPSSRIAVHKLIDWARSGDPRGVAHLSDAMRDGYVIDGNWSGLISSEHKEAA